MRKAFLIAGSVLALSAAVVVLSSQMKKAAPTWQDRSNEAARSRKRETTVAKADPNERPAAWSVMVSAMSQQAPARTPALLKALEEMQAIAFDHELRESLRAIIDQGDLTETQAVISLLEQREEVDAVKFLASLIVHENEDVRHRAWMACEALAGQTMTSATEITEWASSWQADPDVAELMRATIGDEATAESPAPTMIHPSARQARPSTLQREQSNSSPAAHDEIGD
jgi:hypothetical protein